MPPNLPIFSILCELIERINSISMAQRSEFKLIDLTLIFVFPQAIVKIYQLHLFK